MFIFDGMFKKDLKFGDNLSLVVCCSWWKVLEEVTF